MPKYFCEYCGIYLTHSSPGGRKQHSHGRKHINNKIEYYSQFLYEFQQNANQNVPRAGVLPGPPMMPNQIHPQIGTINMPPRMGMPLRPPIFQQNIQ